MVDRQVVPANHGAFSGIVYHNLDHFDRATGAEACLQGRIPERPTGKRFTPPGFQSGMDMERSHLIARQFGGKNTDPRNIVPLFKGANLAMRKEPEKYIEDSAGRGRASVCLRRTALP